MKLWPFYTFTFDTSLSSTEAIARLHAEIGRAPLFTFEFGPINATVRSKDERRLFLGEKRPYGGVFSNNLNTAPGDLRTYNSFQALVHAQIIPTARGARVQASLRLSALIIAIVAALFIAPLIWFAWQIVAAHLRGEESMLLFALAPLGMIAFLWLFACFLFSEDAATAEQMLRAILERDPTPSASP